MQISTHQASRRYAPNSSSAPQLGTLCTGQIHPAERVRAWVDAVARFAHLSSLSDTSTTDGRIGFEPLDSGFAGRLDYVTVANWRVSKFAAGGYSLTFGGSPGVHAPRNLLVALQLKGASTFRHDGGEISLGSGEIAVIPAHKPVRIDNERYVEHYLLWCLDTQAGPGLPGLDTRGMRHLRGQTAVQRLLRSLVETLLSEPTMCSESREQFLANTLTWLLQQTLESPDADRLADASGKPSRELIVRHIEDNLHDPELSLERIAQALGCSKRTLHRAFDGNSSESLNRYLWRRRIERCADELRSPAAAGRRMTVTEIAYSLGFSSSAHFSRLFKQHVGVTPLRYRQGH